MLALGAGSALVLALAAMLANLAGVGLPGPPWVQILAAIATGIVVFVSCEISLAQATGRVTAVGLGEISLATLPLLASAALAASGDATLGSLITAWLAGVSATAALQLWFALRRGGITPVESGIVWRWLWRARGIALSNGMLQLCARVDVLVVSAVLSVSAAGVYSIPVALAANLLLFPRALLTVTYRSIMTAPREGRPDRSLGACVPDADAGHPHDMMRLITPDAPAVARRSRAARAARPDPARRSDPRRRLRVRVLTH